MDNYFQTRSFTLAMALKYLGFSYYVFDDIDGKRYSFKASEEFYNKLEKLNDIRFMEN